LAIARSVGYGFVVFVLLFIAFYVYRRRRAKKRSAGE
jgi:hypothetical protein